MPATRPSDAHAHAHLSGPSSLAARLTEVRKNGTLNYLRPDGKTQVTVRNIDGATAAVRIDTVRRLHPARSEDIEQDAAARGRHRARSSRPVFDAEGLALADDCEVSTSTPPAASSSAARMGDAGLTGRKIIVDTYGGMRRHGGGAFSGKDCTKVDRSRRLCGALGSQERRGRRTGRPAARSQIAYAIGVAKPVSVMVETFGTNHVPEEDIERAVSEVFDLRPGAIIDELDLRRPIYQKTAAYGHFGRELPEFTWEKTDRVDALRAACGVE